MFKRKPITTISKAHELAQVVSNSEQYSDTMSHATAAPSTFNIFKYIKNEKSILELNGYL